jgi:hypothetical protein
VYSDRTFRTPSPEYDRERMTRGFRNERMNREGLATSDAALATASAQRCPTLPNILLRQRPLVAAIYPRAADQGAVAVARPHV